MTVDYYCNENGTVVIKMVSSKEEALVDRKNAKEVEAMVGSWKIILNLKYGEFIDIILECIPKKDYN